MAYILPGFGMTLRDRQRAYYYDRLDRLFPGLRQKYEQRYGERYSCTVPKAKRLEQVFRETCTQYGLATCITPYAPEATNQLSLL